VIICRLDRESWKVLETTRMNVIVLYLEDLDE
jgi:hypothetical protein